MKFFDPD